MQRFIMIHFYNDSELSSSMTSFILALTTFNELFIRVFLLSLCFLMKILRNVHSVKFIKIGCHFYVLFSLKFMKPYVIYIPVTFRAASLVLPGNSITVNVFIEGNWFILIFNKTLLDFLLDAIGVIIIIRWVHIYGILVVMILMVSFYADWSHLLDVAPRELSGNIMVSLWPKMAWMIWNVFQH